MLVGFRRRISGGIGGGSRPCVSRTFRTDLFDTSLPRFPPTSPVKNCLPQRRKKIQKKKNTCGEKSTTTRCPEKGNEVIFFFNSPPAEAQTRGLADRTAPRRTSFSGRSSPSTPLRHRRPPCCLHRPRGSGGGTVGIRGRPTPPWCEGARRGPGPPGLERPTTVVVVVGIGGGAKEKFFFKF